MTSSELMRVVLRRWYLMLVGVVLSIGLIYAATHQPGVYWTQFNIVLLPPRDSDQANYLSNPRRALYPMAGVLVRDFNDGDSAPLLASTDATMVGEGMQRGVQVRMPNRGSQWQPEFQANYIDVQVADSSAEAVASAAARVTDKIAQMLADRQDEMQVDPSLRITSLASTADPVVYHVLGSRVRAAVATGLAGAALTTLLVYWCDRWLMSRRRRKQVANA